MMAGHGRPQIFAPSTDPFAPPKLRPPFATVAAREAVSNENTNTGDHPMERNEVEAANGDERVRQDKKTKSGRVEPEASEKNAAPAQAEYALREGGVGKQLGINEARRAESEGENALRRENAKLKEDLNRVSRENEAKQMRVEKLEMQVEWQSEKFEEKEAEVKAKTKSYRDEVIELKRRLEELENRNKEREAHLASVIKLAERHQSECETLKGQCEELAREIENLTTWRDAINCLFPGRPTVREYLAAKEFISKFREANANPTSDLATPPGSVWELLDTKMGPEVFTYIKEPNVADLLLRSKHVQLRPCTRCNAPKFVDTAAVGIALGAPPVQEPLNRIRHACCQDEVCKACHLESLQETIREDWWFGLQRSPGDPSPDGAWLRCPNNSCDKILPIKNSLLIREYMTDLGSPEDVIDKTAELYDHFDLCRAHLKAWKARVPAEYPWEEAMEDTKRFHMVMIKAGLMYDFADETVIAEAKGPKSCIRLCAGQYRKLGDPLPVMVPLFGGLSTVAERQTCAVCYETYPVLLSSEQRKSLLENFWSSKEAEQEPRFRCDVDPRLGAFFPVAEDVVGSCDHIREICLDCIQKLISVKIRNDGRLAVDAIKCPAALCRRTMRIEEIFTYASKDDFVEYRRYHRLKIASAKPGFRHCSNPACNSWFLGRSKETRRSWNMLTCKDCGAKTCYTHDVPWHNGLTCTEYGKQKKRNAPDPAEEAAALARVSKPCPGCSVPTERSKHCYHMTCGNCRHEYCWICLVPYSQVWDEEAGRHKPAGHKDGCPFRDNNFSLNQSPGMRGRNGEVLPELDAVSWRNLPGTSPGPGN